MTLQLSQSAVGEVQQLLGQTDDPARFTKIYNTMISDIVGQYPGGDVSGIAIAADRDVVSWLELAVEVNSGAITTDALAIRINNTVAAYAETGVIHPLYGVVPQASSNEIATSIAQRVIDRNGRLPDFPDLIREHPRTGPPALGITKPAGWARAIAEQVFVSAKIRLPSPFASVFLVFGQRRLSSD